MRKRIWENLRLAHILLVQVYFQEMNADGTNERVAVPVGAAA